MGLNQTTNAMKYLIILLLLSSCAVYPELEPVEWQPRHTGTYVEQDTVVDGVVMFYFKRDTVCQ